MNDVPDRVASGIKMFADDCVIFRNINSGEDHSALQSDLNSLEAWANDWQMSFAPTEEVHGNVHFPQEVSLVSQVLHLWSSS